MRLTRPEPGAFAAGLAYLVNRTRRVSLVEAPDHERTVVMVLGPNDSPFKGIEKAKPARPLEHVGTGLFFVDLTFANYNDQRVTGVSLADAIEKAVVFVADHDEPDPEA